MSGSIRFVEARSEVGLGNALFIRGEGDGLSWEKGQPLVCVDAAKWVWSGHQKEKTVFKLLLNDHIRAQGEDVIVEPGQRVEIVPRSKTRMYHLLPLLGGRVENPRLTQ